MAGQIKQDVELTGTQKRCPQAVRQERTTLPRGASSEPTTRLNRPRRGAAARPCHALAVRDDKVCGREYYSSTV